MRKYCIAFALAAVIGAVMASDSAVAGDYVYVTNPYGTTYVTPYGTSYYYYGTPYYVAADGSTYVTEDGGTYVAAYASASCGVPAPVCLPYTKRVAIDSCNPCATERVVVSAPNIWGKIFGAKHAPTVTPVIGSVVAPAVAPEAAPEVAAGAKEVK